MIRFALALVALLACASPVAAQGFDPVARGLALGALQKTQINAPGGVAPYVYSSILNRAPTRADDLTVGCVVGNNWVYAGHAWTASSCAAGQAHWVPVTSAALPMDVVPGVTVYGWGTAKMRAAYAGAAMTLSDTASHTQAISFLANGLLDAATVDAFNAQYATSYVSTWNEQSASGYNCLPPAAANGPIAPASNTLNGIRSVVFNSVANGIVNQSATQKYCSFATLAWTPSASTMFFVGQQRDTEQTRGLIETPSAAEIILEGFNSAAVGSKITYTSAKGTCNVAPDTGPSVLGITWNGTTSTCANNNTTGTGASAAATAAAGGDIGSSSATYPATMDLSAAVIFPSVLSTANFNAEMLSLEMLYNIQPQADTVLVIDGDSTFAGTGTLTDNSMGRFTIPLLSRPVRYYNVAIHGQTVCGTNGSANRIANEMSNIYSASARDFVVHMMIGENDIRAATSASAMEACLQSYVTNVHALGSNVRLIITIEPLKCDILLNSTKLTTQQSYDAWILANAFVPQASGGLGLTAGNDSIDNMHADPIVGPNSYAASAFCDAPTGTAGNFPNANSPDGVHMLDALSQQAAVDVAASVNAAFH